MKVSVTLLIIAILGCAYANKAIFQSLAEIDQDPFGSTILSAISLNLRVKTPIQDVSNLLAKIRDDLAADLATVEGNYAREKDRLENAINDGTQLITSYDAAIKSLEDSIQTDSATRTTKQTTLKNNRESLAFEQQRVIDWDNKYKAFIPNADADIANLASAINAIANAISKMNAFRATSAGSITSLLEVASSTQKDMKKVSDTIEKMKSTLSKRSNLYSPLVRELLDLTATMDQTKADRVVDLLNQLSTLLTNAKNDVTSQREAFIRDHSKNIAEANKNINTYTAAISQLEQDIQGLDKKISQAQSDLEKTRGLRGSAQEKLNADRAALEKATNFYNDQKPKHQKTLELIKKIIDYFNTNVAAVDQYTQDKINRNQF